MGLSSELAELARLHEAGHLSNDEFATAKQQLLGDVSGPPCSEPESPVDTHAPDPPDASHGEIGGKDRDVAADTGTTERPDTTGTEGPRAEEQARDAERDKPSTVPTSTDAATGDEEWFGTALIVAVVVAPVVGAIIGMVTATTTYGELATSKANSRAQFWSVVVGSAAAALAGVLVARTHTGRLGMLVTGLVLLGGCGAIGAGWTSTTGNEFVAPWQEYTAPAAAPTTEEESNPPPPPPEPPDDEAAGDDVVPGSPVAERLFVNHLRANVYEFSGEPDAALLEVGEQVCSLIDSGYTDAEIFEQMRTMPQTTFEDDDIGRSIAASTRWICRP